ncbi:hypothetical protein D3C72_2314510 [compost metagenome]
MCAQDFVRGTVHIQDELARYDPDQYQHDQADAFLAVIGTVGKADPHGRCDQYQAGPERRMLLAVDGLAFFRRLVHA